MNKSEHLKDLLARQKDLILNTCNKVGCGNCGLEWEENGEKKCSSGELETEIWTLEMEDVL